MLGFGAWSTLLFGFAGSATPACIAPAGVIRCSAPTAEVRAYAQRCLSGDLSLSDNDRATSALARALAYHAALVIFDREYQLASRWVPRSKYQDAWSEMGVKWSRRIARYPYLLEFDSSVDLEPALRGGLERRLRRLAPAPEKPYSGPSAGDKFLMAALYERASSRDRDRVLSTFPELLRTPTDDLLKDFTDRNGRVPLDLKTSLAAQKSPIERDRLVATYVDRILRASPEIASRVERQSEGLFRAQAIGPRDFFDKTLADVLAHPGRIANYPFLLGTARAELENSGTLAGNVAALQCRHYHRRAFWSRIEGVNDRYVLPVLNASIYPLVAATLGISFTSHWLGATGTVAPAAVRAILPWAGRFAAVVGSATVLTGVPSSLVSLRQVSRFEAAAREQFYLSPIPARGASATDLRAYPAHKASAYFNVGLNFAFLGGGAAAILRP